MTTTDFQKGRRRKIQGEILDVMAVSELLGVSPKMVRARVARKLIPFKKWSGRVIFVRSEITEFLKSLSGCEVLEALHNETQRRES